MAQVWPFPAPCAPAWAHPLAISLWPKNSTNCAERALLWPSRSGLQTSKSLRRTRNHQFLTLVALAGTCGRPCSTIRHTRMNTLGVALLATTPLTLVAYDPVTRVKPRGPQCQRPGQPCRAPAPPPPQAPRPRPPGQPSRAPAVPGSIFSRGLGLPPSGLCHPRGCATLVVGVAHPATTASQLVA